MNDRERRLREKSDRLASRFFTLIILIVSHTSQAQTVEYVHTDALGSPVVVTDSAGAVVERSELEPYGALLNRPSDDRPGFTGHVVDAETGLNYMQQRYYDSLIGRFLSVDPVVADSASGENLNRYKYASNNPYRFRDPDGRQERAAEGWSDFAAGGGLFAGGQMADAGVERGRYSSEAAQLRQDDSAGRSALKDESRARTPSMVRAAVQAARPSTAAKPGSGGRANVSNAKANAGGTALKFGGRLMVATAAAQQANEIANSNEPAKEVAGAGGMTLGAIGGGEAGTALGAAIGTALGGPPGGAIGAVIGGLGGASAGGVAGEKVAEEAYEKSRVR